MATLQATSGFRPSLRGVTEPACSTRPPPCANDACQLIATPAASGFTLTSLIAVLSVNGFSSCRAEVIVLPKRAEVIVLPKDEATRCPVFSGRNRGCAADRGRGAAHC